MNNHSKAWWGLVAVLILLGGSGSVYAAIAGRVQYVHGKVMLTTATGVSHAIKKGEPVNEGDTLLSSPTASAQIRMEDGGMVAMRPDTKLKIDRFNYDGQQDGSERSFFSLFKGGFRAITGAVGQKNKVNYHITTPATTIGIRGTDHETFVVTPDSPLSANTATGTYNKVNLGETSMTTEKGSIFVLPNQMGYVGAADQMPRLEPVNLNIYTLTAHPPTQINGNKHEGTTEGRLEGGNRGLRETAITDKDGMRDVAPIDKKVEIQGIEPVSNSGAGSTESTKSAGSTATLTPTTEDSFNNTIPTTTEDMLEQQH